MNVIRVLVSSFTSSAHPSNESKETSPLTAKVVTIFEDIGKGMRSLKASLKGKISPPVRIEKVLKPDQIESLRLLTTIRETIEAGKSVEELHLSSEDKRKVRNFLSECMGSKNLNATLSALVHAKLPDGISATDISEVRRFAFKSMGYERLPELQAKLQNLVESLDQGQLDSLTEKEKFSLVEWGRVNHFEDAVIFLRPFFTEQLLDLEGKNKLEVFFKNAVKMEDDKDKVEAHFQQDVKNNNHYQNGDILAYIGKKWSQFKGTGVDREDWLKSHFITKYGHAGKLYRPHQEEKIKSSEVFEEYRNVTFDLHEAAISHIWRLDVMKLIKTNSAVYRSFVAVCQKNGNKPEEVIEKMYQEIERELHEKGGERLKGIQNVKARRWDAGWADFGLKGGHRRKKERADHYEKVHQKFMRGFEKASDAPVEMICSEFATKATIACLIELDRRLSENMTKFQHCQQMALEVFGDQLQGADRKQAEMAGKILEIMDYNKKDKRLNFLNLPVDNEERLKRIHPGRMVSLLMKKKCIVKVEPPNVVKAVFKRSAFR